MWQCSCFTPTFSFRLHLDILWCFVLISPLDLTICLILSTHRLSINPSRFRTSISSYKKHSQIPPVINEYSFFSQIMCSFLFLPCAVVGQESSVFQGQTTLQQLPRLRWLLSVSGITTWLFLTSSLGWNVAPSNNSFSTLVVLNC